VSKKKHHQLDLDRLALNGLELAPSQVWRGVRIVPLLRTNVQEDLRLARRSYDDDLAVVALDGKHPREKPRTVYASYIPHGLVVNWSDDGSPAGAFGTHLAKRDGQVKDFGCMKVRLAHRMIRREDKRQLRMLPMHLSMEGFLALHFGGPDIAWSEYARAALRYGLGFRIERSVRGTYIAGLADALRVFEFHENQVGVLVFVADALASAFVVSHPEDYRALHRTLLADFYGELMYWYGVYYQEAARMEAQIDESQVENLTQLRRGYERMRGEWVGFHNFMAEGLLGRPLMTNNVYRLGPFQLIRFMTGLEPSVENHLGEAIFRQDGTLEYLKTYRLAAAQCRRAYLLSKLAEYKWNLDATARALGGSTDDLILRLEKAGFGYLLKEEVLKAARKRKGKR